MKYLGVAITGNGGALPIEQAPTVSKRAALIGGQDSPAHNERSQMVDDDRLVASHHPLLVHQSFEDERQRTAAWITDALAHGEKVLVKHRFWPEPSNRRLMS